QEIFAGVELCLGSAAAHKNHIFHGVAGNDIGHNVLHAVHINVIHGFFSFFSSYNIKRLHKAKGMGYLNRAVRLDQETEGVDHNAAHNAGQQQPAGADLLFDQGVHAHHDSQINSAGQNRVNDVLKDQACGL